jgi:ABC-type branched-subunit amino acid transport system ATPase component
LITGSDRRSPLVGREDEFAVLAGVLRRVRQGGQIVVVEGEAGIGRSRLVDAALGSARAAGTAVLASSADELDGHRPCAAVLDLSSSADDPLA